MNHYVHSRANPAFEHWINEVNRICGSFTAAPIGNAFSGRISEHRQGSVKMSYVDVAHANLSRTPDDLSRSAGDHYFVVFQLDGQSIMKQGNDGVMLSKGDITLISGAQPCDFQYGAESRQVSLILPFAVVNRNLRTEQLTCAQTIAGHSFSATLSRNLLQELSDFDNLSHLESEAALDALVSLLSPALTGKSQQDGRQDRMITRVMDFIDANIASDCLAPEQIANEVGLSVRTLYRLFSNQGVGVVKYIRNRRLDLCAEALKVSSPDEKLSAIGYAMGFTDCSYFSTAFKARFGMSPGDYRRLHGNAGK